MKSLLLRCALSTALLVTPLLASAVPLTFTNEGVDGQTTVFRAALGGLGLTQVASVGVADSGSASGGSNGVFSGFDLDFVFIDRDGNYATTGDRIFGASFVFSTGAIRLPTTPGFDEPTLLRPGPTIGSSATNTIDSAWATLNVRDGFFPGGFNTDNVLGWLTLGDGGVLLLDFGGSVALTGTEALFIGEVGTSAGELVNANVTASDRPLPEPGVLGLFGVAILLAGAARRRR